MTSYPGQELGVPEGISSDYMNVLVIGSATANPLTSDAFVKVRIKKLALILDMLMKRHLSDSPGLSDKRKFSIDLLQTALAIAKGELIP